VTADAPRPGAVAVIPVRDGTLPIGADETVAEAGGRALVVGDGTDRAARALQTATQVACAELGPFAPGRWAAALAPYLGPIAVVILPASPDGRDLAPRLADALGRPLFAGAIAVGPDRAVLARRGGLVTEEHAISGPAVATLEPGVRGFTPLAGAPAVSTVDLGAGPADGAAPAEGSGDAEVLEVLPADPATMDLSEAPRIIAGGAGLGGPEPFELLRTIAPALGASWGASRVAADAGWVPPDRFIGTTGVAVNPRLYIAFGVSGAVQHVSGLGSPDHIIAVNTDPSAPMMAMADLAIVVDAPALLAELAARLGGAEGDPADQVVGAGAGPVGPVDRR
jgi:electron transfer flavoprotein alpha subunit